MTGRRADGLHELDSLVVFASAGDELWAEPDNPPASTLSIKGPFARALPATEDNLVLRAARALAEAIGGPLAARLTLSKHLPVASGIGGGSADAAAALRLLCRMWSVPGEAVDLPHLARSLGADVPVCLASCPARMRGIGERLEAAPLIPDCGIVLINPGVAVATAEVFRARRAGGFSAPADLPSSWPDAGAMAGTLAGLRNDLEASAIGLCPEIAEVRGALSGHPDCLLARMSGSGATCFGLFADPASAEAAAGRLLRPGWWSWGGGLLKGPADPRAIASAQVPRTSY